MHWKKCHIFCFPGCLAPGNVEYSGLVLAPGTAVYYAHALPEVNFEYKSGAKRKKNTL